MRTVRTLWRDRAFSSIAIAMFALGIGATTVIFSLVNGLLACLGIYGVVSYAVAGRTNEVGIRMALGARGLSVLSMVLGQSIRPVLVGLAVGLVAAFALVSRIEAMLFEVTARDPLVFAAVALVLLGVGLAACFVPARRASRIEPLEALRYE